MLTTRQALPLLLLELLYTGINLAAWIPAALFLGDNIAALILGIFAIGSFSVIHDYEVKSLRPWASTTRVAAYWLSRYALPLCVVPLPGFLVGLVLSSGHLFLLITLALFGVWFWWRNTLVHPPVAAVRRGTVLLTSEQARERAAALDPTCRDTLPWGGIDIPVSTAIGHFCVVGAPGSGKTVTLKLLMQSLLPEIREGADFRAIVYDAKRDIRSYLDGLKLNCPIHILNPFDARCVAWNIAADITSPASALQLAGTLIPDDEGVNRFFSDAARAILRGVLKAFIRLAPKRWTLRDVILAMGSEQYLRDLLNAHPDTAGLIEKYFRENRTFHDIQSTIATRMDSYEPIAALWSRARYSISLEEWVRGDSILILGNDESLRTPIDMLNRLIFQRATELILALPDSTTRRTWVFLDELKEAGRLDLLPRLMTNGRSKGARVVIGFQDIEGFRHVYGEKLAHEIAGISANKAILRLDSEPTATWASATLGEAELTEVTTSFSPNQAGHTFSEHIAQRQAVLSSELRQLPPPADGVFHGFYIVPGVGAYRAAVDFKARLARPGMEPDFELRSTDDQYLLPWTEEDQQRLGLKATAVTTPPPSDTPLLDSISRITREPIP